jgi:hypothetical protein
MSKDGKGLFKDLKRPILFSPLVYPSRQEIVDFSLAERALIRAKQVK